MLSFPKSTGPSNTESTDGPHFHCATPSGLPQKLMPEARACRFGNKLNWKPNHPWLGFAVVVVQSDEIAPPSVVYCTVPLPKSNMSPSLGFAKRTRCRLMDGKVTSLLHV